MAGLSQRRDLFRLKCLVGHQAAHQQVLPLEAEESGTTVTTNARVRTTAVMGW
ncbi:MAG: hypothetical protein KF814_06030 [Nitrospiraceae bacterium]|nr:hypothetical protein [Nitrospiraceae bacterium]